MLGLHPATIRRWIAQGAPVVRRGRRGNGGATLVDPAALAVWQRREIGGAAGFARVLAAEVPELVADAIAAAFRQADGAHKRVLAGEMACAWHEVTQAVQRRLREEAPDIPELNSVPAQIEHLRSICEQSGKLPRSS